MKKSGNAEIGYKHTPAMSVVTSNTSNAVVHVKMSCIYGGFRFLFLVYLDQFREL